MNYDDCATICAKQEEIIYLNLCEPAAAAIKTDK